MLDTAGVARIVQAGGQPSGQSAASLDLTQDQQTAVRRDGAAVKPGDDILVENR